MGGSNGVCQEHARLIAVDKQDKRNVGAIRENRGCDRAVWMRVYVSLPRDTLVRLRVRTRNLGLTNPYELDDADSSF